MPGFLLCLYGKTTSIFHVSLIWMEKSTSPEGVEKRRGGESCRVTALLPKARVMEFPRNS